MFIASAYSVIDFMEKLMILGRERICVKTFLNVKINFWVGFNENKMGND